MMKKRAERDPEARMTFTEHLGELRTRIIRVGVAFIVGFAVCYMFSGLVFDIVRRPLEKPGVPWLIASEATSHSDNGETASSGNAENPEPETGDLEDAVQWLQKNPLEWFLLSLKLSAYGSLFITLPYILYQVCGFVFPGLRSNEKKIVLTMLIGCSGLSLAGLMVAYFGVFPLVLPYILQWTPDGVTTMLSITETISIILMGLFGFAVVFQFPMVVLVLVHLDLLTPATLKRYRKQAIVGLAVLSAILTPPDPISMSFMMAPLVLLYEASIWTSYLVVRRKRKAAEATQSA
jgi:sec-independent protein translocase protein TatC